MSRYTIVPPAAPTGAPPAEHGAPGGRRPVLWRTWMVRPERVPAGGTVPLLTGLFGFPWRQATMDAKCTQRDRAIDGFGMSTTMDRHHRVVPHPQCTCGIYAGADELVAARVPPPLRGRPFVTGFVELSGRMIRTGDVTRAEHAAIIGPLTISAGRPTWGAEISSRAGGHPRPTRVFTEREEYRVSWAPGRTGTPLPAWLREVASGLAERYGVPVVASGTIEP